MSRRLTALLAAAALVGSLAGGALAGWRDALTLRADATLGYVHYAVGDPAVPPGPLQDEAAFTGPDGSPGWTLPSDVLADLTPATPQTAVVQIDGYAQGNRGLSYRLPAVDVTGDDSLLAISQLRIVLVEAPPQCAPHMPDVPAGPGEEAPPNPDPLASLPVLYQGPALDASFGDSELVAPEDLQGSVGEDAWRQDSRTHYLCLELSLPGLRYENTASVTAVVPGAEPFPVTDTDTWAADVEPTEAQRAAAVTLRLPYSTYRAGGAVDRALLAVEITHTNPDSAGTHSVGDRLEFSYDVVNLTDTARATARVISNLTGDADCRWQNQAPGALMACSSGYHVVTAEDVARGYFRPTATWAIHSGPFYPGITSVAHVTGDPVRLTSP